MSRDQWKAPYELDEPEKLPWKWLGVIALIVWAVAWWLFY